VCGTPAATTPPAAAGTAALPVETYEFTPNGAAEQAARTIGGIAGVLGPWGELVTLGVSGLFGIYASVRSRRYRKTAEVLTQVIETGRAVLASTPNGSAAMEAWTQWMIQHQAETGVFEEVVKLLGSAVDPASARGVAAELLQQVQSPRSKVQSPEAAVAGGK
jgi:hypothetical protein